MYSAANCSGGRLLSSSRRSAGKCVRILSTPILRKIRANDEYDLCGLLLSSSSERWTEDSTKSIKLPWSGRDCSLLSAAATPKPDEPPDAAKVSPEAGSRLRP